MSGGFPSFVVVLEASVPDAGRVVFGCCRVALGAYWAAEADHFGAVVSFCSCSGRLVVEGVVEQWRFALAGCAGESWVDQ